MSRHVVAATARTLAEAGYCVLVPDLYGCGDAPGDFVDATWSGWSQDMAAALEHLRSQYQLPVTLWGLRAGALLAAQLAQADGDIDALMLWHPVLNGEQQVDQFLRLHSAATALNSGETFDRKSLWSALRDGQVLDVAGYALAPALAMEMAEVRLATLQPGCNVGWLDISSSSSATAATHVLDRWRDTGADVQHVAVVGQPFWRTIDAPVNSVLTQQTCDMLRGWA